MSSHTDHLVGPAVRGYLAAALWTHDEEVGGGEYAADLTRVEADTESAVRDEVTAFVLANAEDVIEYVKRRSAGGRHEGQGPVAYAAECLGHDLMLTRNHHGVGFWDRGLGDLGERLTKAAHALGEDHYFETEGGELGRM